MRRHSNFNQIFISLVFLSLFLPACDSDELQVASQTHSKSATIRICSFNIAVGGREIENGEPVIKAIILSNADVIGIQEIWSNGNWFKEQLEARQGIKWYLGQSNLDTVVLSKFPIIRKLKGEGFEVKLSNGSSIAIFNRHLRGYPYGPYELRAGVSPQTVLNDEKYHVIEMAETIETMDFYARKGWPVFLTGDFNAPSHMDWTSQTAASNFNLEFSWPLSIALEQRAIKDSYRSVWPDPATHPGYTWTEGWPPPRVSDPSEKFDRIDYVYFKGQGLRVIDSQVIGLGVSRSTTDLGVTPWGSDHRAVVSTFYLSASDDAGHN